MRAPTRRHQTSIECRWLVSARRVVLPLQVGFLGRFPLLWPEDALVDLESGDGKVRNCKAEGYEEGFTPQTPLTESADDLLWVPPWPSRLLDDLKRRRSPFPSAQMVPIKDMKAERKAFPASAGRSTAETRHTRHRSTVNTQVKSMELEGLSAGGFSGEGQMMRNQWINRNWGYSYALRIPQAPEQMWLKVFLWWYLDPRGCDLQKVRFFPINDLLCLRFEIGWLASLGVRLSMFSSDANLEALISNGVGINLYDWVVGYLFSLVCCYYEAICLSQFVCALFELVRKDILWERIGLTFLSPNTRFLHMSSSAKYIWSRVAECGREVMSLVGLLVKDCAVDRQVTNIILGLYSMPVSIVHFWFNMCLFGVVINTVQYRTRHGPVQCVWHFYSTLVWSWVSFPFCLFYCEFTDNLLNVFLLGYNFVPRNLVRNLSCRCVLREADLVVERSAKASMARFCPCVQAFLPLSQMQAYASNDVDDILVLFLCLFYIELFYICLSSLLGRYWKVTSSFNLFGCCNFDYVTLYLCYV